jgi:hypothetical protein
VSILSSKRWADCRQRNFRRGIDGIGREIVEEEKQRKSRKETADACYNGLGTQLFLIAFGARRLARWCSAGRDVFLRFEISMKLN